MIEFAQAGPNHATALLLTNGVWRANGYLRVSYPQDDEETVRSRVLQTRSRWLVCDFEAAELCLSVAKKCDWKIMVVIVDPMDRDVPNGCISFQEYLDDDGSEIPEYKLTENDTAIILCTSGTTGPSKGAVKTHKALVTDIRNLSRFPFTTEKPNIIACTGVHISGTVFPLAVFASGATGIVLSTVNSKIMIQTVHKYKPGLVYGFISFILALCGPEAKDFDMSSVEILFSGGSLITPSIKNKFLALPNVRDFVILYGLTEHLTTATNVDCTENSIYPTIRDTPGISVGKLFPGVSIQIRDPSTNEPCGLNETGEICVKSDSNFKCYFDDPKSTGSAFTEDGYIRSGDLGYYDQNGFLFITGRQKEIFKYFNNHISPTEIEGVIAQHSAVNEVCVVGVPDEGGYVPRAFVTLKDTGFSEATANVSKLTEEITNLANSKLSSYKHLRGGLYIMKELPKGSSGKVARLLVAKLPLPT